MQRQAAAQLSPYTTLFRSADGFRFDTGPSWLLMREVFAHFYALLGRDIDAELPMRQLDPAYRSEEHTSELQSRGHRVCRLLLEKKNDSHKTVDHHWQRECR